MSDKPASIKFYTDTHIAKAVAAQLRNRGIDVVRCEEIGMAEAKDIEHLEYAVQENRVVITCDDDFIVLAQEWAKANKNHSGIMFCLTHVQGEAAIGIIVKKCIQIVDNVANNTSTIETSIANQVIYVS
ncbi:MAG: DUF5615 family PIN-like protein [Anaerolineae bacterium]|nr:DUF5615 family PIN-like protein [Anaerolineae bacterium]